MSCRLCGGVTSEVIDFGFHPLGNGFSCDDQKNCYRFPLVLDFCDPCKTFQLREQPLRSQMFHDAYAFVSGTSERMKKHFKNVSEQMTEFLQLGADSTVCEIGCNDGIFLANFVGKVNKCIGFEPSMNVGVLAEEKGCEVINDFFSHELAASLQMQGSVDLIYGANVICHIPDFLDVLTGVGKLLSDRGVFVFEEPYVLDVFSKCSFDQLYDEHVYLFGVASVENAARKVGLELIKVEHVSTHGGSMRYFVAKPGMKKCESVRRFLFEENWNMIYSIVGIDRFRGLVRQSKSKLLELLQSKVSDGVDVVSYGATSKSTTVFNYCGIDRDLIGKALDVTASKIGCFIPGTNIPVVSPTDVELGDEVAVFLGAWNHGFEIMEREKKAGATCSWISHVPFVREIQ